MGFIWQELQIEPTNRCNLKCSICSHTLFKAPRKKDLSLAQFQIILDKFKNTAKRIFLQGLGEPFLNRQINQMICSASQRGLFVYTTTNANGLNEKAARGMVLAGLNELRVSIDTFNPALYKRIKSRGRLDRAVNAVKLINQKKKELGFSNPVLRLNTVLMKENLSSLPQLIDTAADLGFVEVSLIPLVIHGKGLAVEANNVSAFCDNQIEKLILEAGKQAEKKGIQLVSGISSERHPESMPIQQPAAPRCFHSCYIQSNGDLSPCCNIAISFGNIFEEGIAKIMVGKKTKTLLDFIEQNKPACRDCVNFVYKNLNR